MAIDISKDIDEGVSAENMAIVLTQARVLFKLEIEIEELELKLKEKKKEHFALASERLPELMSSVGLKEDGQSLPLANGYKLELKPTLRVNLPAKTTIAEADEDERPFLLQRVKDGLAWLRKKKGDYIIKNTLKIDLGKDSAAVAKEFIALAKKHHVVAERDQTVHNGSLKKFIGECIKSGVKDIPEETFALFNGRVATVVAPPKPKPQMKGQ